jgi:hypothetical protein
MLQRDRNQQREYQAGWKREDRTPTDQPPANQDLKPINKDLTSRKNQKSEIVNRLFDPTHRRFQTFASTFLGLASTASIIGASCIW